MANKKATKTAGEKSAQLTRSIRNKKNRIERSRAKHVRKNGEKSPWYIKAKLGNRLRRLNRRVKEVAPDRRKAIVDRINEIEKVLVA